MIIWDGLNFLNVDRKEAEQLIKEDKAQDVSKEDGLSLKYRHQFTGYVTREMRAESPVPEAPVPEAPAADVQEDEPVEVDWREFADAYKKATGARRANKTDVIAWIEAGGSDE